VARTVADRVLSEVRAPDWFLDGGIGTGRYGRALAARHRRTVGVDVSRGMMAELRATVTAAAQPCPWLARADLRALPFATGSLGGVLLAHVFHLIADWPRALDEAWRVLRPGAILWLAREDETDLSVRSFYLRRASERGVLPPNPGARTQQVVEALQQRADAPARVRELARIGPGGKTVRWTREWSAREMLDLLGGRTYSVQWTIPEQVHRTLLAETRAWTRRTFGTLEVRQRAETQLVLYECRKIDSRIAGQ
jgi:ubiquinone/menaquinone biosynthesis C-methylase UbiE